MIKGGHTASKSIAGQVISLNTGVLARQANGSVIIECKDTTLLATAVMSKEPKPDIDFFPLTVEFSEKMYAAGKIPGGFLKREARPSTNATLIARLIDRPIRPCFPKNFYNDVQVVVTVLSYDPTTCIESLSIIAASAAIRISDIPFNASVGAAVIGLKDGQFLINPSVTELEECELNITVAGTKDAILMIEAGANEVPESTIISAILKAHEVIKETVELQEEFAKEVGKQKAQVPEVSDETKEVESRVAGIVGNSIEIALTGQNKKELESTFSEIQDNVIRALSNVTGDNVKQIKASFEKIKKEQIRNTIIKKKIRPDGRTTTEIRPISIQTGVLPSAHGSSVFTRGETQSLGVVTLGSSLDEQILDGLEDAERSKYFFHYNFPPFSVGEVGPIRTSRRELGHGALAERALKTVLPSHEEFPYTIRIVSEILESNGSSSMASVCSGSMALMDCGVPIKSPVSGIAMGLLINQNGYTILSDIQGLEDHYGDMDFKVAGTINGVTALQLDIKVAGLSKNILEEALAQAKQGRLHILNTMNEVISKHKPELAANAPKIHTFNIDPEKVGLVIGPGGKMIRKIEEESGASVMVTNGSSGEVTIAAKNGESLQKALNAIHTLTKEAEVGEIYDGTVTKIMNFGAFVEILPGKEGLIHISKLSEHRLNRVEEVINAGDKIRVIVDQIDNQNRINLVPEKRFE